MAEEGAPHGVCALAVAPGFMRTEQILDHFGATEQNWREVARTSAEARGFGFAGSETPCFVGRAVAALASDPGVTELSGGVFSSWELAERYGFNDLNGERLHWGRYLAEHFPRLADSKTATGRRWEITGGSAGLPAAAAGPTMGEAPAH